MNGEQYYQELGLEQYGFTPKEKQAICDYYNHYKATIPALQESIPRQRERSGNPDIPTMAERALV